LPFVRTRFAPSPTGELHIGGARTALFNFLLARGAAKTQGGKGYFVLRIDDTDRKRSRLEFERQLMEDLHWLGLDWDEGPDMGLPVPYRQSQRISLYEEVLRTLRERKAAVYPCFCSETRLEALRAEQFARGEPPRYDGLCRHLPPDEVERRITAGEKPCWRFALPDAPLVFYDAVRGEATFVPGSMGDFVLVRSDGLPTYLFASVADDHLMGITHIVRGDEHIPNTARQQALFDALGWMAPIYAHIPMILSPERQKLSKRTGSTPIRRYRQEGYLPEALSAYLSTLSWNSEPGVPLLSLNEMASAFSLVRISASPPIHDETHLRYWQKEALRRKGPEFLVKEFLATDPRLSAFNVEVLGRLAADLSEENPTLPLLREALGFLTERPEAERPPWLPELRTALCLIDSWEEDVLNRALRAFMKEREMKGKEFFHPLRLLLTGRESGAALVLVMSALGRDEVMERLGSKG
jgi:glutamyl-tRNA synthetase